jgi:hypothetical protein
LDQADTTRQTAYGVMNFKQATAKVPAAALKLVNECKFCVFRCKTDTIVTHNELHSFIEEQKPLRFSHTTSGGDYRIGEQAC